MKRNLIVILFAIILIIVIVLVLVIFFKKPKVSTITDCQDIECVKSYAMAKDFNHQDCEKALPDFKNDCYYTYEVENSQAVKDNPGKQCGPITDENLRADCFYKTRGVAIMTKDVMKIMLEAVEELDIEKCNEINVSELKEECISYLGLVQEAVDKEDSSLCRSFSRELYVPSRIEQACEMLLKEEEQPLPRERP